MNESKSQLRIGVVLSYINLGIGCLIPFIYTPVMLRILGQSEYGLYSLSNSVINYLTLLTFGFGSTVIRYLSKYRAEDNKEAVQKTFGLFLFLYSIAATLAGAKYRSRQKTERPQQSSRPVARGYILERLTQSLFYLFVYMINIPIITSVKLHNSI